MTEINNSSEVRSGIVTDSTAGLTLKDLVLEEVSEMKKADLNTTKDQVQVAHQEDMEDLHRERTMDPLVVVRDDSVMETDHL